MNGLINAGIVGGEGYLAGELIRLLHDHEDVNLKFVHSDKHAGKKISEVHRGMAWDCDLIFSDMWNTEADVIFLCDFDQSKNFLLGNIIPFGVKIVNLNSDSIAEYIRTKSKGVEYGLPELNKERIMRSHSIVDPGCYETSVELAMIPLVSYLTEDIHIYSLISSTSVNQITSPISHFNWRYNNISIGKFLTVAKRAGPRNGCTQSRLWAAL